MGKGPSRFGASFHDVYGMRRLHDSNHTFCPCLKGFVCFMFCCVIFCRASSCAARASSLALFRELRRSVAAGAVVSTARGNATGLTPYMR